MKKIHAYLPNRVNYALSNYMPGCNLGYDKAKEEMIRIIEKYDTPSLLCYILNNHKWTADNFAPYQPTENGFIIKATDPWGNNTFIRITEEEEN